MSSTRHLPALCIRAVSAYSSARLNSRATVTGGLRHPAPLSVSICTHRGLHPSEIHSDSKPLAGLRQYQRTKRSPYKSLCTCLQTRFRACYFQWFIIRTSERDICHKHLCISIKYKTRRQKIFTTLKPHSCKRKLIQLTGTTAFQSPAVMLLLPMLQACPIDLFQQFRGQQCIKNTAWFPEQVLRIA